ncbi:MAG TPA: undecaprenyl-diphosphate phosphatase [Candidatus Saccharimonadales bacterium]|nr:undecaprenyl-diphosphate phosphatase [Candidatus Saccharimonadales bacterium]
MFTYFQAIIFGLVQGITELFPISSLGHSVILPKLLGWHINQNDQFFLTFLVATHTATAVVLFFFFWRDWKRIFVGFIRSLKEREINDSDADAKLAWLLVVATIPAGILGLLFEDSLKKLFASPQLVAAILVVNGGMLFGAELLRRKNLQRKQTEQGSDKRIAKLTWMQAVKVGLLQSISLLPGFSRTGASITGSLLVGLSHEDAARFSFLLATPIIGAASLLKLPELLTPQASKSLGPTLVGTLAAGIAAYFSVKFLTKYFETKKLTPFAIYCAIVGGLVSLLFLLPL